MLGRGLLLSAVLILILSAGHVEALRCNVTATGFSFGGYDPLSPIPASTTGSIGVTCNVKAKNKEAPVSVEISVSPGQSGSFGQRYMTSASGAMLYYNLYMDAGGGSVWGDGSGGSGNQVVNVTKESPYNARVYGRIPALQNVPPGSYSDLITVSIFY